MSRIAIVDSGGANIASLLYAFERLGIDANLTTNSETIRTANRVVLPGVGAARDAMQRLQDANLVDVIRGLEQPVLGICLGMQLLCESSEEEDVECLGIIPGVVRKLHVSDGYSVPNMGWCETYATAAHPVLDGISDGSWFYFLHSYALPVCSATIASARHSGDFSAMVCKDNFVAAQFHPERSSDSGARLLRNFVEWQS
jgi:glutamine amidotransferase